jgi:hypothetical protein
VAQAKEIAECTFKPKINNSEKKTNFIRLSSNKKLSTEDRLINSARIKEQRL